MLKPHNFLRGLIAGRRGIPIAVVSGLPRSGTSMLMRMLAEGGLPTLTDGLRQADQHNPGGYYEYERVKRLDKGEIDWLPDARGKAVKIVSALLGDLPPDYDYRVIFMQRHLDEIVRSQMLMLASDGKSSGSVSPDELQSRYRQHMQSVMHWISQQPHVQVLYVHYNQLIIDPAQYAAEIADFLHYPLDQFKMAAVVDPSLYRNRSANS
jgi:hypothetical protein